MDAKITYFNEDRSKDKTIQKQRGYIIASEYGGPIDVASWVLYRDNLDQLPNIYAGKYAYVYEENEIYFHNGTEWIQWTNCDRPEITTGTPAFKLLFYESSNHTKTEPCEEIYDTIGTGARIGVELEARVYVKPNGFDNWIQFGNVAESPEGTNHVYDYPKNLRFRWFLNSKANEIPQEFIRNNYRIVTQYETTSNGETTKRYLYDNFSETNFEVVNIICIAYYNGKAIVSNKIPYKNNSMLMEPLSSQNGLLYLTSKTPQLQRGYVMSSEQGGSIDATTSVNSKDDLASFTNNYLGKLIYSYSQFTDDTISDKILSNEFLTHADGYLYFSNTKAAHFPRTGLTQEEKIREVVDNTAGAYVPIGGLDVSNNIELSWGITGQNYRTDSSVYNGIHGKIAGISGNNGAVDDNIGPKDIQRRRQNGYAAYYEAHMYMNVNGTTTEVPVSPSKSDLKNGSVFYEWKVEKPSDSEYYDPSDYIPDGVPSQGEDENRTVWVKGVDYELVGNASSLDASVVNIGSDSFDFDSSTYQTGTITAPGQLLECIYTNDYDDPDIVRISCTAYFKDEDGYVRSVDSRTYKISIENEHLIFVVPEGANSESGIKDITVDEGTFVIDGGPTAVVDDFMVTGNNYEVGYRILHYRNEADAQAQTNETVLCLYSTDLSESISVLTIDNPTPAVIATGEGPFTFRFHVTGNTSTIPFGWYRVEVFRGSFAESRENSELRLYTSSAFHFYQEVINTDLFATPQKIWLGYYDRHGRDISENHTYLVSIEANGKNLLDKNIPTIDTNGQIEKSNTISIAYARPDGKWISCIKNASSVSVSGTQEFTDPRTQAGSKNRTIEYYYYSTNDTIKKYENSILVYNVMTPDLDLVVDSIYKRPDGSDIFIWNTDAYTVVNPTPYAVPYDGATSNIVNELPNGVVTNWEWTYNGVNIGASPKLDFKGLSTLEDNNGNLLYSSNLDGFEAIANVNNAPGVITDTANKHLTGKVFSPEVYNITVSIEQPSIQSDSDYYETNRDYEIRAHVWWSTSDPMTRDKYTNEYNKPWHDYLTESSEWHEFTDEEIGNDAYFNWKETDDRDIWFSNNSPSTSSTRAKAIGGSLEDGYKNVSIWFTDETIVKAWAKLYVKVFGYPVTISEEIRVRNPIDQLTCSYKIYTGTSSRTYKTYARSNTRQLESERVELTVNPVIVDWVDWDDIRNDLVFMIDGEIVDENSTKYTIEYDGIRNHFYEGTFRVYWKNVDDIPDSTHTFNLYLNRATVQQEVPIALIRVTSMVLYPYGYGSFASGVPSQDNVFINAKVGTTQRYVLDIEGTNLDDDGRYLFLKRAGFADTNNDGSLSSSDPEEDAPGSIFKRKSVSSSRIMYYIEDDADKNTRYTVTYKDANRDNVSVGKTFVYDNESIRGFGTSSAYFLNSPNSGFVYMKPEWINISSSFEPAYIYEQVVKNNSVTENENSYLSVVEYDLHNIGIISGNNILRKSKEDVRSKYSIDISRELDVFTTVIKNYDTDVTTTLPDITSVTYLWMHGGVCEVVAPSDSMRLNYIELYNNTDNDATEVLSLNVTMFSHNSTFKNYTDTTLQISDYVLTKSASYSVPKLLYQMTVTKNPVNMSISKAYPISSLIDSIVCVVFRRDLEHKIEETTFTGSNLDSASNNKLVFSIQHSNAKPAVISTVSNNRQVIVSTDAGCDILIEWKRTESDTKASSLESWTSNIVKTSISILPTTANWDLKVSPEINTTISLTGQNLRYAYQQEGNDFLKVEEVGNTSHTASFNPGITSNEQGTYQYASSWTDTGHPFAGDSEERTYKYKFGNSSADFTAIYATRKIVSLTLIPPCLVVNQTYQEINVPFSISSVNMFGPDVDIINNDYDLTWTSTPTGSVVSGTFTSAAGNVGSGNLKLTQTSLSDNTPISVTATREEASTIGSGTVKVAKVTGISNVTLLNGKASITVTGQNLDCTTLYAKVSTSSDFSQEVEDLGSVSQSSSANSYTWNNISYTNTKYHGGVTKYFKVYIGNGNLEGQYATETVAAANPSDLILTVSNLSSPMTVTCTATSATITWTGKIEAVYADGSKKVIEENVSHSDSSLTFTNNIRTSTSKTIYRTITWRETREGKTKDEIISVQINQEKDTWYTCECGNYTSAGGDAFDTCNGTTYVYAYGTCTEGWASDNPQPKSCKSTGSLITANNCNTRVSTYETGIYYGFEYSIYVPGDEVDEENPTTVWGQCAYSVTNPNNDHCQASITGYQYYTIETYYKYGHAVASSSESYKYTWGSETYTSEDTNQWCFEWGNGCSKHCETFSDDCYSDPCEDDTINPTYSIIPDTNTYEYDYDVEPSPGSNGECPCTCYTTTYTYASRNMYKDGKFCGYETNVLVNTETTSESCTYPDGEEIYFGGKKFYISCIQENPGQEVNPGDNPGGGGGGNSGDDQGDDPVNPLPDLPGPRPKEDELDDEDHEAPTFP